MRDEEADPKESSPIDVQAILEQANRVRLASGSHREIASVVPGAAEALRRDPLEEVRPVLGKNLQEPIPTTLRCA